MNCQHILITKGVLFLLLRLESNVRVWKDGFVLNSVYELPY